MDRETPPTQWGWALRGVGCLIIFLGLVRLVQLAELRGGVPAGTVAEVLLQILVGSISFFALAHIIDVVRDTQSEVSQLRSRSRPTNAKSFDIPEPVVPRPSRAAETETLSPAQLAELGQKEEDRGAGRDIQCKACGTWNGRTKYCRTCNAEL